MRNQTGGRVLDTFEVFLQRVVGLLVSNPFERKVEMFFDAIRGGGEWWENLLDIALTPRKIRDQIESELQVIRLGLISTAVIGQLTTNEDYRKIRDYLDVQIDQNRRLFFFPHSQGNLFANVAYDYVVGRDDRAKDSIKVVYVAPASRDVRGPYVLADADVIIAGLDEAAGGAPAPNVNIPNPFRPKAGLSGDADPLGHSLLDVYMNPNYPAISGILEALVLQEIGMLVAPGPELEPGYFTARLSWEGPGDIDLHVFEPGSAHVWWGNPLGDAGFLESDAVVSEEVERYRATCDEALLQTGVYEVRVANYSGAEGATANLRITSWEDGLLTAKNIVLGAQTEEDPSEDGFDVWVDRQFDQAAGRWRYPVSVVPAP